MSKKITTHFVRSYFEKNGYELDDDFEYVGTHAKIFFTCPKGHEHNISWNHFKNFGQRCAVCFGNNKPTKETIIETFEESGYQIIEPFKYVNQNTKINFICDKGHEHSTTWNSFKSGIRCAVCSKKNKPTKETIIKSFEEVGYQIIEPLEYINSKSKINFICDKGHEHSICLNNLKNGIRCGKCFTEKHHSYRDFLESSIYLKIYQKAKIQNKNLTRKQFDEWVKEDESNIDIDALVEIYKKCLKGFSVDHIIPCSYFDFTDMNQIYHCWKTINLRYLPTLENISRGNRMSYKDFKQLIQGNEQLTNLFFMAQNKPEKLMFEIGCI